MLITWTKSGQQCLQTTSLSAANPSQTHSFLFPQNWIQKLCFSTSLTFTSLTAYSFWTKHKYNLSWIILWDLNPCPTCLLYNWPDFIHIAFNWTWTFVFIHTLSVTGCSSSVLHGMLDVVCWCCCCMLMTSSYANWFKTKLVRGERLINYASRNNYIWITTMKPDNVAQINKVCSAHCLSL